MDKSFVLKAVKKIAAIGAGAVLLASTLTAATALDLGDFPEPFVTNGVYDTSTVLVVGADADVADVNGQTDVAVAFQQASRIPVSGTGGISASVEGGVTIRKSGDELNLGETLNDIQDTPLEDDDLAILADGTYEDTEGENKNTETYTQELDLSADAHEMIFEAEDDDDEIAAVYLKLNEGFKPYVYTLEFNSPVDYDNSSEGDADEDFEGTTLEIQGNLYTITDVKLDGGMIEEIEMLAGDTVVSLKEGDTAQGITVDNVNENEDKCTVTGPDGTLYVIEEGATRTIDGVQVGVIEVIAIHQAAQDVDICKLTLGATEVKFVDGQEVEINGEEVDDSEVTFIQTVGGELEGLTIDYELDDDMWLAEGESWTDPVLGNFAISFVAWNSDPEDITLDVSSTSGKLSFTNANGDMVEIPIYSDETDLWFGNSEDDERLLFEGDDIDCDPLGTDASDCEGTMLFVVDSGEAAHIVKITDINEDDDEIDFEDLTEDKEYNTRDLFLDDNDGYPLGGLGTINLTITSDGNLTAEIIQLDDEAESKNEALFDDFTWDYDVDGSEDINITITENDEEGVEEDITLRIWYDDSDDLQVEVLDVTGGPGEFGPVDESAANDDDQWWATVWGTMIKEDVENKKTIEIMHPAEQAYAQVVVAPTGAAISAIPTGDQYIVVDIQPDTKIYPDEITSVSNRNAVLIGGPCANPLVEQVAGLTCDGMLADYTAGEAVVKLVKQDGKYALVVAGRDADDTRRAAKMLLNYKNYASDLDGKTEVIVKGTSINTITEVA